jgi:endogenous inhibitor of DNA gyrase (YacG/DUF329 family)
MNCEFCNNKFSNKSSMYNHQKTAKYCIKIQGKDISLFKCKYCDKILSTKQNLHIHIGSCSKYNENVNINKWQDEKKSIINEYKVYAQADTDKISFLQEKLQEKDKLLSKYESTIKDLQKQMENIALRAVSYNFEEETTIDIDNTQFTDCSDSESDDDGDDNQEYKLTPLELGKGITIEHREEDGYINVTNLCKAGGKQFKHWKSIQKTKAFLQVLSNEVGIPTSLLISHKTGFGSDQGTWVHPQVAINIAQWISPQFDVKVSGWVYEIMMTGKVDITNTTSFKQLQQENKNHKIRIQHLTKKYVKAQPRKQYEERNVVYILTTKLMKKDRRYILGKATNLTSRLSVYNKSDEHQVVYYQECGDEETMSMVENMVFYQLNNYREQANRERFLLPEKEEIYLFSNIINKSIEFFNK